MNRAPAGEKRRIRNGWLPWAISIVAVAGIGYRTIAARVIDPSNSGEVVPAHRGTSPRQSVPAGQTPVHPYFTDVVLVNQNGEKLRFYSDLLKGKVVVINSFFGTCLESCLPMNRNLERVQQALGDRLGKDVHIISISVDPMVDTVASLKEYAKTFHARPGWHFLTGDKQSVDAALRKLGQFVDNRQDHVNIVIIGNERTGLWKKAFGLAQSAELVKVVESVLNDRPVGGK